MAAHCFCCGCFSKSNYLYGHLNYDNVDQDSVLVVSVLVLVKKSEEV